MVTAISSPFSPSIVYGLTIWLICRTSPGTCLYVSGFLYVAQSCARDGEIRLVGGYAPSEGLLEVCSNTSTSGTGDRVWRSVRRTSENFDTANAEVVCRQLQSQNNWNYSIASEFSLPSHIMLQALQLLFYMTVSIIVPETYVVYLSGPCDYMQALLFGRGAISEDQPVWTWEPHSSVKAMNPG